MHEAKVHEIWGSNKAAPGREDEFLARFQLIVDAEDQGVFELLYRKLKEDYAELPALLAYIEDSMMPWQHEWAEYICRHIPSFGQRTTSRLEGSHCHLKKALVNRSGDPYDLVKDLHFLIQRDRNEQKAKVDKAELRISTGHNQLMLSKLHTKVTPFALDLLRKQIALAKDPAYVPGTCSGGFQATYNLPCKHRIHSWLAKDAQFTLEPSQIGEHWHFYPSRKENDKPLHDFARKNPAIAKPKGRPKA
jgi:hypothetical protein